MTLRGAALGLAGFLLLGALATAETKGDPAVGKAVYQEICFSCHGEKGDGKGPSHRTTHPLPQVFANPNYMARLTDAYMFDVVKYGKLSVLKGEKRSGDYRVLAMPGFEDALGDQEVRALIAYEKSLRTGRLDLPAQLGVTPERVKTLFEDACAECHGLKGRGNGPTALGNQRPDRPFVSVVQPAPADQTDPLFMDRFNEEYIFWLIKKGRIEATTEKNYDTMKPYGHVLSDEEIWSVIRYIRETFISPRGEGK